MKFADSADGLASILRFANYLHLPVDHPKVVELFHIFDSVMNFFSYKFIYFLSINMLHFFFVREFISFCWFFFLGSIRNVKFQKVCCWSLLSICLNDEIHPS